MERALRPGLMNHATKEIMPSAESTVLELINGMTNLSIRETGAKIKLAE